MQNPGYVYSICRSDEQLFRIRLGGSSCNTATVSQLSSLIIADSLIEVIIWCKAKLSVETLSCCNIFHDLIRWKLSFKPLKPSNLRAASMHYRWEQAASIPLDVLWKVVSALPYVQQLTVTFKHLKIRERVPLRNTEKTQKQLFFILWKIRNIVFFRYFQRSQNSNSEAVSSFLHSVGGRAYILSLCLYVPDYRVQSKTLRYPHTTDTNRNGRTLPWITVSYGRLLLLLHSWRK